VYQHSYGMQSGYYSRGNIHTAWGVITTKLLDFVHRPDFYKPEIRTMDKVQKLSSNECYTPSSEPYRRLGECILQSWQHSYGLESVYYSRGNIHTACRVHITAVATFIRLGECVYYSRGNIHTAWRMCITAVPTSIRLGECV
jgi:hypothetical protein